MTRIYIYTYVYIYIYLIYLFFSISGSQKTELLFAFDKGLTPKDVEKIFGDKRPVYVSKFYEIVQFETIYYLYKSCRLIFSIS